MKLTKLVILLKIILNYDKKKNTGIVSLNMQKIRCLVLFQKNRFNKDSCKRF